MYKYKAFGLTISSEMELPELIPNEEGVDVHIHYKKLNIPEEKPLVEGNNFIVTKEGVFLFWDDVGKIFVQNGNYILVDPIPDIDVNLLRLNILGVSFGVLLHQRGFLVLHASSVSINGQGVAFIGNSGLGKSTIAFSLVQNGHSIISDDVLPIKIDDESIEIYPGFPALKLSKDVLSSKNLKTNPDFQKYFYPFKNGFLNSPLKLKQIFLLEHGNTMSFSKVNKREALISLIKNSYCIKIFKENEKKQNLIQCAGLTKKIPITRLEYYKSLHELTKLSKIIEMKASDSGDVKN